ncbi:uncharacterized protein Ecym_2289 [Eremothecium cymbalariae DBVPG|uniref:Uncharacterized protein n=1 Tax=Eremothecium cymbalariae (strain CBS 270.75 / DBVPG 7215 / KCTC 17166 / NRRL Y-17582) TaxID=931890 RepID=G8JPS7_ERECY|nr:Hypothetical protein Ecym_2289 [Eremothecium cymbalariae DBVPG\
MELYYGFYSENNVCCDATVTLSCMGEDAGRTEMPEGLSGGYDDDECEDMIVDFNMGSLEAMNLKTWQMMVEVADKLERL